jgi:hypothetical protein
MRRTEKLDKYQTHAHSVTRSVGTPHTKSVCADTAGLGTDGASNIAGSAHYRRHRHFKLVPIVRLDCVRTLSFSSCKTRRYTVMITCRLTNGRIDQGSCAAAAAGMGLPDASNADPDDLRVDGEGRDSARADAGSFGGRGLTPNVSSSRFVASRTVLLSR